MVRLVTEIFTRAGCSRAEAARVAARLAGANLRGHDSHGVIRTPRYLGWLDDGLMVPGRDISIERETDNIAIIDGNYGFGQTVGEQTVAIGVTKALAHGVGVTALKNSGHLGRIGDWAELAAESNVVSIHMVNVRGSLLVAPFGGTERRMGTSPFCAGIPRPGLPPIVLDFATSLVAEGKALVALRGGAPLPEGALIRPDGSYTSDPSPLYGDIAPGRYADPGTGPGALCPFGLHKGSGLNFLMEMMAGALGGSGTAGAVGEPRRRFCNGMFSLYFAVEAFHGDEWFANEVRSYVEFVKSSKPIEPGGEVLVPGEKELRTMAARLERGLPLSETAWQDILGGARKVGMGEDDIRRALEGGAG
ncbi:MAG: Ldh family oxidoreductase [Gammaproteobacteria bacterium]|nr:Ldh family oxidoreductase [Gammaproteobacteria bacterium]